MGQSRDECMGCCRQHAAGAAAGGGPAHQAQRTQQAWWGLAQARPRRGQPYAAARNTTPAPAAGRRPPHRPPRQLQAGRLGRPGQRESFAACKSLAAEMFLNNHKTTHPPPTHQ
jgi:hypothetical protein